MSSDEQAIAALHQLKATPKQTWAGVAQILSSRIGQKVNKGLVYQVAMGKTKSPIVRRALGLPIEHIEVEPCPCGKAHTHICKEGADINRRGKSSDPLFLAVLQQSIVPFLQQREATNAALGIPRPRSKRPPRPYSRPQ